MPGSVESRPQEFEIVREPPRGRIRHALFDFDGTISLLREGWQRIMGPVMVEMICGDSPPVPEIERAVSAYIDESTGMQTIVQMQHLAKMVREFGRVPAGEILDPHEYKAIYNERLMVPVLERLDRLGRGELTLDDVTLAGVREFIAALAARDLTMYIFSGTDQDDVRNEAEKLQVAQYFSEIWGALRTIEEYSKEKVLREIIATHGLHGEEVLIIGDGPVEIRNARDAGCVTLGVASDEVSGHGWNERKRRRLRNSGAHVLVPDFAEWPELVNYFFPAASSSS